MTDPVLFAAPLKHSVTIAGHQTSISLEPLFWAALRRAAAEDGIAINALIGHIDEERLESLRGANSATERGVEVSPPNLASAIRCWLWRRNVGGSEDAQ